jgi:hypothetical protein
MGGICGRSVLNLSYICGVEMDIMCAGAEFGGEM